MNKQIKVVTVFGTRSEAIKMAQLVKELEKYNDKIQSIETVTAQHLQKNSRSHPLLF
ncbi:UDP-N-acetylglucosamine 2-epimerase [Neobacillus niacini]|nr:UDP-N-acetylglucosamine 2-epimerase [Neobacillus niacini]